MTTRIVATIYHAEGIAFDDLDGLNAELMNAENPSLNAVYATGAANLSEWNGVFVIDGNDELLMADAESRERCTYGSSSSVGDHWTSSVTEALARHLIAGELVFEIVENEAIHEYLVITPGSFDVREEY